MSWGALFFVLFNVFMVQDALVSDGIIECTTEKTPHLEAHCQPTPRQ